MIDNFYQIKPLNDWLKTDAGLIYQNKDAFVTLNTVPSSFGHSLVIPKRVVYKATDLSPKELNNFHDAKERGIEQLEFLLNRNHDHILDIYMKWANDTELNKVLPCKDRIHQVLIDISYGKFSGDCNIFENIGEKAGQMVKQYHIQIVPRHIEGLKGCGEALFRYLHYS